MNHALFLLLTPTQESNPGANLRSNEQIKTASEMVSMIFSYVGTSNEYTNFNIVLVHDGCKIAQKPC